MALAHAFPLPSTAEVNDDQVRELSGPDHLKPEGGNFVLYWWQPWCRQLWLPAEPWIQGAVMCGCVALAFELLQQPLLFPVGWGSCVSSCGWTLWGWPFCAFLGMSPFDDLRCWGEVGKMWQASLLGGTRTALNDVSGCWLVLQCCIYGQTFEFATVYAPQSSLLRA
ncbi:hypothetical protein L7F22_037990 [Adiantum nelumboides]|nr:hypothetical protein [Adiantum nelumboides]